MRGIIKRGVALVSTLTLVLGLGTALTSAQNNNQSGNGFRISPVRSEITVEKGKSTQITVTIENPTDIPTTAKPIVNDFVASDKEDGEPRLILEDIGPAPKNSFKSLVPKIDDVALGAREKKDIQVTVSVPESASAGGYFGAIRFAPDVTNTAGNVGLTASVGTIVLVRVPGDLTEKLELLQLSASQGDKAKSLVTSGNVDAIVRLKNSGNIHVKPFGRVQVKNMFGKVVKEYELNSVEPRANILPDSTRKFTDSIGKPGIGRNTITANIGYSQGGGDLISAKSTFWYIPTWLLLGLLAVLLAIAATVYMLLKRRDNKTSHKSKK